MQITDGYFPQYGVKQPSKSTASSEGRQASTAPLAAPRPTSSESPQFERFEHQLSAGTVDNITPSERTGGSR
jgi:hypothetical protein